MARVPPLRSNHCRRDRAANEAFDDGDLSAQLTRTSNEDTVTDGQARAAGAGGQVDRGKVRTNRAFIGASWQPAPRCGLGDRVEDLLALCHWSRQQLHSSVTCAPSGARSPWVVEARGLGAADEVAYRAPCPGSAAGARALSLPLRTRRRLAHLRPTFARTRHPGS